MRNILTKIKDSVYSPSYYHELTKEPFSYSFKYLLVFALLFSLLVLVKSAVMSFPQINSTVNKIGPAIINTYPDELVVSIKDGDISTNVAEPYYIKMPSSLKMFFADLDDMSKNYESYKNPTDNLITIDTNSDPVPENLEKFNTAVLITRNYVIFKDKNNKTTIQSFKDMKGSGSLDKQLVIKGVNKISPYFKILLPIFAVVIYVGTFLSVVLNMIYLFIIALLVWLIAAIKKAGIGYWKSYQFSMHLMTLPILLSLIPYSVPYQYSLVLLILAALNISKKAGTLG